MKTRLGKNIGSTRVSRVQFGVPPNCGRACVFALARERFSQRRVPLVSGATPETTRRRRVLPSRINNFRHA